MSRTARIVVLPGDGIGPEVIDAALLVLEATAARFGLSLAFERRLIGAAALHQGLAPLPDETLDACRAADAVLLGAVGHPDFDRAPRNEKPETALLRLRKELGLYANLRPARMWPGLEEAGPLKPERVSGTDLLIVRELAGGLYYGEPRGFDADGTAAFNTLRYTTGEIERVARVAFDAAQGRRGKLTLVDKANVLETSQLWSTTVERMAGSFPSVRLDHLYVDACAMLLAQEPRRFDVILTENMFGDILSDEAGSVCGSIGLLPSASLGDGPGLYEPVHGSAPTLAGTDVANPIGAIGSAALLLRHSLRHEQAAAAIEDAIAATLAAGRRTPDIATGSAPALSCSAVGRHVADRVRQTA